MGKSILTIVIKLKFNKIKFFKEDNIYQIIWITGLQDNILGVTFDQKNKNDNNIKMIEYNFPNI